LPLNIQEKIFIPQIEIAQKNHKPLIIHCVRLYNEVVRIIKQQKFNLPVVFHGFNANSDTLKQLLKFDNFYFSVSEKILNGKNNIYKALEFLPLEKLLIESDTDKNTDFQRLLTNISMLKHEETNVVKKYIQNNFKKLLSL
jgi:TatD DNase family protein